VLARRAAARASRRERPLGVLRAAREADLGARSTQERRQEAALPSREADADRRARVLLSHAALEREVLDDLLELAALTRLGIHVARVAEIGGDEELFDRSAPAATGRHRRAIVREAPAGVERDAEAADGTADHQRLEAEERRRDVDVRDLLEQSDRIHRRGQRAHARIAQLAAEVPGALSRGDVRVRLHDHLGLGVLGERGSEHVRERLGLAPAEAHAEIARGLIDDEHARPRARPERARGRLVVLGDARLADPIDRSARAISICCERVVLAEHRLEPRGRGRVVVDAEVVHDDRERRLALYAEPERAHEAVLEREEGDAVLERVAARARGVRLLAPADHVIDAAQRAGAQDDRLRAEERREIGDASDTRREHAHAAERSIRRRELQRHGRRIVVCARLRARGAIKARGCHGRARGLLRCRRREAAPDPGSTRGSRRRSRARGAARATRRARSAPAARR
jgi:hypothetical protein